MSVQSVKRNNFSGGITTIGEKTGPENSARFIKNLNIFESPDYVTLSPKLTKVSGSTVTGKVLWMADGSPWDSNRYFYDSDGKIYQETSGGTWSTLRTVANSGGQGMIVFNNALYYARNQDLGRYGQLDDTPSFEDSFSNWWLVNQIQQTEGGTGATDYTPQTSIDEGATHRQTFIADHDPIKEITINVDVVGSGDWTLTLHDSGDNVLGTVTIVNASMTTGDVTFTFSDQIRVRPNAEYHFHVTSTVADGGIDTETASDMEGSYTLVEYYPLVNTTYHPMIDHVAGIVIGNDNHLAFYDQDVYDPTRVTLDLGYTVRTITKFDEFVVAFAWKGQSFAKAEAGRLYFWDGIEPTYNYSTDVLIGACNALTNYKNSLVGIYGNRGAMYAGNSPFTEIIDKLPDISRGKRVEVYPGAISEHEGKIVTGYAGETDDNDVEQGIYTFGSQTDAIPAGLAMSHEISTGTSTGTSTAITSVKSFGEDLYVAWKDGSDYGVDKLTAGDTAVASGSFEERIFDAGDPDRDKQAIKVEITFEPLTTGQSVTPKYKINRATSWTNGTTQSTTGATKAEVYINSIFKEIEWGFDPASLNGTYPVITGENFVFDLMEQESDEA